METCLNCGSGVVERIELNYGTDFRPDVHGDVPQTGDVIDSCGVCREFEIVGEYAWPAERQQDDDQGDDQGAAAGADVEPDGEGRGHGWW